MHDATDMEMDRKIQWLRDFESEVITHFEQGAIRGPVHLSHGNEYDLIRIFQNIKSTDWVFSTWRNHYHALLHGIDRDRVMTAILAGHSINYSDPTHRFMTSAIVGGILPIACGVAAGIKERGAAEHVWCFVGDMTATIGAFHDAVAYAEGWALPITFVIEDNGMSTNTPTDAAWGEFSEGSGIDNFVTTRVMRYQYVEASTAIEGRRKRAEKLSMLMVNSAEVKSRSTPF